MHEPMPAAMRITRAFTAVGEPGQRRVLVLDDEESIRLVIAKFLRSRGYEVETASDGPAALERLRTERFDALLCDIRMPEMSGLDVVPQAIEARPDLAILMLTAVNDAPTATEALAQGAMDYLMKPIELPDLVRAVERALYKRDLDLQQRTVERLIRDEVAVRLGELRHSWSRRLIQALEGLDNGGMNAE